MTGYTPGPWFVASLDGWRMLRRGSAEAGTGSHRQARGPHRSGIGTMDLLTVDEVKSRLPIKISERALRRKLRDYGRIITHRNQIALNSALWPDFLDWLAKCSASSNAPIARTGRSSGRALTPESACAKARALIAKSKPSKSLQRS